MKRIAVLDLGTNTFHLMVVEVVEGKVEELYKERQFVKIGRGGISDGRITEEACQRALRTMFHYGNIIKEYGVEQIAATATSALRSAQNGNQLLADIEACSGVRPEIISGTQEAELIFEGVRSDIALGEDYVLVMDIGGGSVELMIGNAQELAWKHSYEIGAQRLVDKFHQADPIPNEKIEALHQFLDKTLSEFHQMLKKYQPQLLIGSAGAYETLWDMHVGNGITVGEEIRLSATEFSKIYEQLIHSTKEEREVMPGMIGPRVEMIVVAAILVDYILEVTGIGEIRITRASLKEGVLGRCLGD